MRCYGLASPQRVLVRLGSNLRQQTIYKTRRFSTMPVSTKFEMVESSRPIEEETVRGYKAEHYYPVQIGQLLNNRYKVIGKLGYGSASTVWFCRDLDNDKDPVALKIYINNSKVHRELPIYTHINNLESEHRGRHNVRKLLRSFELEGPHGTHICLVHQPLGINFNELKELAPNGVFGVDLVRQTIRHILAGLQFLHEAHVIHTDLQPNNMLLGINKSSTFERFEQYEAEDPVPRKELDGRIIYMSRPMPLSTGPPVLSDLSEARFGDVEQTDLIMPDIYRAPEVILGMPWSYPVDMWALGMVIWDLFEGKPLLVAKDKDNRYCDTIHLAKMIAVLGPPPLDFLKRAKYSWKFWHENGEWKGVVPIPDISLESLELKLKGEDKELFLTFMRKMLKWRPEDRGDCKETFFDEWLLADLIESGEVVREE